RKLLNPDIDCCENKCRSGSTTTPGASDPILEKYREFGVLGIRVRIDESSIPSLVNIALTTFLGIIALYTLFRGIYVAGIKRTNATSEDEFSSINKEFTALIIGFIIAFTSIFLVQLVFNVLGLGSLTDFT